MFPLQGYDYEQEAEIHTNTWNEIILDNPYSIPQNGFFIGYQINATKNSSPLGFDDILTDNVNSDMVAIGNNWQHLGSQFGNLCIQAVIRGKTLPQNSALFNFLDVPAYIEKDREFYVTADIINTGVNAINSANIECLMNGEKIESPVVSLNPEIIKPGKYGEITISGLSYPAAEKNVSMKLKLTSLNNDMIGDNIQNSLNAGITCLEEAYDRNVIVEEWTGTWCGWCPRGIVGMNFMGEHYGDEGFIGIAVHNNDEMAVSQYQEVIKKYGSSFPDCSINRNFIVDPIQDNLEYFYKYYRNRVSTVNVGLKIECDQSLGSEIKATAIVKSALDLSGKPYKLAFVITENNVGPYMQSNYYSGGAQGETLEGWTELPSKVSILFNDVARSINSSFGITGSLPSTIDKYIEYDYSVTLKTDNVSDINNCAVIAFVINSKTGEIENGTKVNIADITGINELAASDRTIESTEYYDISGIKTENPVKGIYIRVDNMNDGSKEVHKIILR